jgi:hypothetical protein
MKGPLFMALEERDFRDRQLNSEQLRDIETEYTFLLQARGVATFRTKRNRKMSLFDEMLSLAVLCWFTFPGKKPRYQEQVQAFLREFSGISGNTILQTRFRNGITPAFRNAKTFEDIQLTELSIVFRVSG